jgi:N-acyl-D-aspartate/D-glutamate deacylase
VTYDVKIIGGVLIDGTGAPRRNGDIGIAGGRIVALGHAPDIASRTIRADGLIVAPGFVDIHTHYDAQILWDPTLSVSSWHGVTTAIMSSCGFGIAPTRPEHRGLILRTLERVEGMSLDALEAGLGADWGFVNFDEYLRTIAARGTALNLGAMAGHTPIRLAVMGEDAVERAARDDEIAAMQRELATCLDAGAFGFATSVSPIHVGFAGKPIPSRLAEPREFQALATTMRGHGGVVHYNVSREALFDAYMMMAEASGRPVIWTAILSGQLGPWKHRVPLARNRELRAKGWDLTPQVACRPIVQEFDMAAPVPFDSWKFFEPVRAAADRAARARLYADAGFRRAFREEVAGQGGRDSYFAGGADEGATRRRSFHRIEIASFAPDRALVGRKLVDVAAARGVAASDCLLDLALASDLQAKFRMALVNDEEDEVEEILRDPQVLLGLGDGGAHLSQLCDACYTTHLLGHWVRKRKAFTLEEAVRMLTSRPADAYAIAGRGRLVPGAPADIVIFDADTVHAGPLQRVRDLPGGADRLVSYPQGIAHVLVNGVELAKPGEIATKFGGQVLRQGR